MLRRAMALLQIIQKGKSPHDSVFSGYKTLKLTFNKPDFAWQL